MNVQIMEEVKRDENADDWEDAEEEVDKQDTTEEDTGNHTNPHMPSGKLESCASIARRLGMKEHTVRKRLQEALDGRDTPYRNRGRPIKKKAWTPEIIMHATAQQTLKDQFSMSMKDRTTALNQTFGIPEDQ